MVNLTLPELPYVVFDKVDGSCVQIFRYFDEIVVMTLGSFQSDQSKIAEKLLYSKYSDSLKHIEPGFTYIFELIVPENRIVLNYGDDSKLVLLTVRDNDDDSEFLPTSIGFPVVDELKLSIEQLMIEKSRPDFVNKEGFVIRFSNGFRVKIKYEEYFRLHKIMTGVNEKFVWEFMKEGKEIPLDGVPDEFFQYVTSIKEQLLDKYSEIDFVASSTFRELFVEGESRKEFAMKALKSPWKHILFKMYEKKKYDQLIWDEIEPKFVKSNFQSLRIEDDN